MTGEKVDAAAFLLAGKPPKPPEVASSELLSEILGKSAEGARGPDEKPATARLIRGRFFVYRYDPTKRTEEFPQPPTSTREQPGAVAESYQVLTGSPPTLRLPPVPKAIQPDHWYLVAELVFLLPYRGRPMKRRILVEVETNAILYLRALTS